MLKGKKLILLAVCMWFISPVVYGDMTPLAQIRCQSECPSQILSSEEYLLRSGLPIQLSSDIFGLDFGTFEFIPESGMEVERASNVMHLQISASDSGSCYLCLYTLIGLGLYSSVSRVKKISFGFIPEWYHDGGPCQIGHSYAVMPGTLRSVANCCFIQPEYIGEDVLTRYSKGIGISLLRSSKFVSDILLSRGPPKPQNRIIVM
jgi:hypothetical protein